MSMLVCETDPRKLSTSSFSYKHHHIIRESSVATIETRSTTASKNPMLNTMSSAFSDTRRHSAPLSIAERFMSPNYNIDNTTEKDGPLSTVQEVSSDAPNNKSTCDRLSLVVSPPPLYLSSDPGQQDEPYQPVCCNSHHPLDTLLNKTICSCAHQSICNPHETVTQTKKKKKRHTSHRPTRKRHMPSKLAVVEQEKHLPKEEEKIDATGIWVGKCCFIRCGGETLPRQDHHKKSNNDLACCCCGRRTWVISIFLVVIMVAVMMFLFYPRVPLIRIEGAVNSVPTKVSQTQQGGRTSNVAFESTWLLNVTMDNRRNYITTRLNRVQIIAKDAMTGLLIGKGLNNNEEIGDNTIIYLPGQAISTIQLPVSLNYQARDSADATFSNLLRACAVSVNNQNSTIMDNEINNNSNRMPVSMVEPPNHHALSIHFWFTLYIFGLDWTGYKPNVIATPATGGFFCPSSLT